MFRSVPQQRRSIRCCCAGAGAQNTARTPQLTADSQSSSDRLSRCCGVQRTATHSSAATFGAALLGYCGVSDVAVLRCRGTFGGVMVGHCDGVVLWCCRGLPTGSTERHQNATAHSTCRQPVDGRLSLPQHRRNNAVIPIASMLTHPARLCCRPTMWGIVKEGGVRPLRKGRLLSCSKNSAFLLNCRKERLSSSKSSASLLSCRKERLSSSRTVPFFWNAARNCRLSCSKNSAFLLRYCRTERQGAFLFPSSVLFFSNIVRKGLLLI